MLAALVLHLLVYMSLIAGRLHPMTFSAVLTIRCRAFLSASVHSKKCWVVLTQLWVKYGLTQPLG